MDLLSLCTDYSEKQQIRNSHFRMEHVSSRDLLAVAIFRGTDKTPSLSYWGRVHTHTTHTLTHTFITHIHS